MTAPLRADRMRATGWVILVGGMVGAAIFYVLQTRALGPELDDRTALGYTRSMQHEMGVMMGHFGLLLSEWQARLTSPAGEAAMIALGAGLLAAYFFRVAWVLDHDDQE
jgi:hypothetical protein